ncbi:putative transcription activator of gluconeogenesis [Coleophoma cylindrospora]|uniref:Putative transcription activator of gluconeogenesis n=1 Tax=Coleophoma cylindrospora TaxID=1849047 RepID=A0A3D8RN00_9HELO|nr:putative transcription activator of gluconeogenesis [Coleophoma cylindrospora]
MPEDIESYDDAEASDAASDSEHELEVVAKEEDDTSDMAQQKFESDENGSTVIAAAKPKLDPKDPSRPRRKKARRACFACQRAHLTCGDERPCQRCIKRGLADACQDGVRKKAKYLHDAPPEALRPVLGPTYNQALNNSNSNRAKNGPPTGSTTASDSSPGMTSGFFPQADASPSFPIFAQNQGQQMPPPLQANMSFGQQSPLSPNFQTPNNRQNSSMQNIPQVSNDMSSSFGGALFDPSNPALFNFDLEGLNFGNQYGAMEFGMLGHMSSGAAETPPHDKSGSISQQSVSDVGFNSFGNNVNQFGQMYPQDMLPDFVSVDRQNSIFSNNGMQHLPHAYAIANGPTSINSPSTEASPNAVGFESPTTATYSAPHTQQQQQRAKQARQEARVATQKWPTSVLGKRNRDPSKIYETVHEPYSYTAGFHSLTAFLQRRFSPNKTLRIAKSLASIRPSFISCTKTLNRQDLIFMEKCFQRTLFEYEDFMLSCCTPTVVCRRTGEIAAVNKEFCIMTGWQRDVLLGKEANLNVNTGRPAHDPASGPGSSGSTGRAGLATPLTMAGKPYVEGRPQPVFLAELLDDDSVVEFYEDFARLAFGDSRGSVTTTCKMLKYQTKETPEGQGSIATKSAEGPSKKDGLLGHKVSKIDGEWGINRLEKDGKIECSYCWTVKRDVFDIPMLIVMNFLPFI